MFFVNDEQAEALKINVFAEQLVCAHHNVNRAVCNAFDGSSDFFGRAKTAHLGDLDGPLGKAVYQRLIVLFCQ